MQENILCSAWVDIEMHPQVQTLLSMLGLQEERVAHPRVRDIDSRYDSTDNSDIENYDHNVEKIVLVSQFKKPVLTRWWSAGLPHTLSELQCLICTLWIEAKTSWKYCSLFSIKVKYVPERAELTLLPGRLPMYLPITSSNNLSSLPPARDYKTNLKTASTAKSWRKPTASRVLDQDQGRREGNQLGEKSLQTVSADVLVVLAVRVTLVRKITSSILTENTIL